MYLPIYTLPTQVHRYVFVKFKVSSQKVRYTRVIFIIKCVGSIGMGIAASQFFDQCSWQTFIVIHFRREACWPLGESHKQVGPQVIGTRRGMQCGHFCERLSHLVIGDPDQVLKKWVSGFDFKKPGYPGRVSGFQNIENKASKMSQITKKQYFSAKRVQSSHPLEISNFKLLEGIM